MGITQDDGGAISAAEIFAGYLAQREDDDAPEFEALIGEHPELDSELRRMHDLWSRVEPHVGRLIGDRPVLPSSAGTPPPRERYEIEGELGRGGMGVVLRVHDGALRRELALKVARPDNGPLGDRRRRRFLREARITARLAHPGILPVHEIHVDDTGRAAYSMPVVGGDTLEVILRRVAEGDPEWSRERVLGVLQRVCEALAHAHERGIVHRDLKPANIMVGAFGETYVVDWGLARSDRDGDSADGTALDWTPALDPDAAPGLTSDGDVVGTPAYMAPEQADGRMDDVGPASDTYAVGSMLYELLAGRPPYRGGGAREIVDRVRAGPPQPLERFDPTPPAELVAICERAMAREPRERYASIGALADDLRAHLEGRVVSAYATGGWAELTKWIQRNRGLAAALGTVVLVTLIGLLVILHLQRQRAREGLLAADGYRLRGYVAEAQELWPAVPATIPAMEAWLERARVLAGRRDEHRARLARTSGEGRDELVELLAAFDGLAGPQPDSDGGLIADVERRVAFARTLVERTLTPVADGGTTWADVRAAVAADPRFDGLDLAPQLGLVPIGPDPRTGLHEFAHLASGLPPVRDRSGQLVLEPASSIVLVLIPGGEATMGAWQPSDEHPEGSPHVDAAASPSESPVHTVSLEPFLIAKYELTRAQWLRITGELPILDWERSPDMQLPVCGLTWRMAMDAAKRIDLTLPTEAQWEYAARGGNPGRWWGDGGDTPLAEAEWFGPDGPAPVGTHLPNPFGLHDTMGNNFEWARERRGDYTDPVEPGDGARARPRPSVYRLVRGGSWGIPAHLARVSMRMVDGPDSARAVNGARLARAIRAEHLGS
ncbi:bifunctional serine/threonine-protein kinase/formylglycine-generating enzyme family protein [Engelhardtia mirabilis]|uniref:Serine/threonine-protein kinase PknD n=1 Tax=Engelhardtia mirabilis TaxID=2528011 RepID=A0A518BEL8_9BACT|nr:Serine/threonine-protein kinase PknD [Planctomycetes bacterium Pla133]QDU99765.1 Serine/threonine-protein kinase PknD [Planctomycetes bacterium Pla86]